MIAAPGARARAPRARGVLIGILTTAVSLGVSAFLLEFLARKALPGLPKKLVEAQPLAATGLEVPDPDLFWRYRPNTHLVWKNVDIRTNAFGLRDRERTRAKPPGTFRILSLGESTTFGDRVEFEKTYSYRLEEALNADSTLGRAVEVWDCGACSYSSYQSLRWLQLEGPSLEPDLVLFYHEINDFLPTHHRTGDGHAIGLGRSDLELAAARSHFVGPMAILEKSHFYRWFRIRVLLAASGAVRGRPPWSRADSTAALEAMEPRFPWDDLPAGRSLRKAWPDTLPYMENTNTLCRVPDADRRRVLSTLVEWTRARGVDLVLIHPAYKPSRPHRCVLTEIALREKTPVVEFEHLLWSAASKPVDFDRYKREIFVDRYHPTAEGHRTLADALAEIVRPRIPLDSRSDPD